MARGSDKDVMTALSTRERAKGQRRKPRRDRDPIEWQEEHSPTEAVMVKIDNTRVRQMCVRRKQDARLFESLDADQERAAGWIIAGIVAVTGSISHGVQRFERVACGMAPDQREAFLEDARRSFVAWFRQCKARGVSYGAVLDIVVDGLGATETDRKHRKRNGWAAEQLRDGLDLFSRLQGWKPWPRINIAG